MSGIGASFGSYVSGFLGSLGSGIGSGVVNDIFGESLEDRQKYALEQMEKQAELNRKQYEQQFKDQLRVSDPAFIRARLESAGLSPSLALSGGATSSGLNTSISGVSTPSAPSNGLKMASFGNVAETAARIRNLDADTESKQTDTDYHRQAMQTRLDILSQEKLSKIYSNTIARIDSLYKEDLTKATLDKLQREMDAISFDMANRKELTDIERQKLGGYLESLTHQYALWQSQIGLNEAKTKTEGTVQELNQAKTSTEGTIQRLNDAKSWSQEFENFKWENNGTIKPGMNLLQGLTALIGDLPSNFSKSFKDIQSIGNYIDDKFNNLKNIVIKDVESFIADVNDIASSTNKLDSFIRMLEKNVGKFAN